MAYSITHQPIGLLERYKNVMRDDEILKVHQELVKQPNIDGKMRKGINFEIAKLRAINVVKKLKPPQAMLEISPEGPRARIG